MSGGFETAGPATVHLVRPEAALLHCARCPRSDVGAPAKFRAAGSKYLMKSKQDSVLLHGDFELT